MINCPVLPFSEEGHQWTPHRTLPRRRPNTPALPPFDSGVYAHLQDVTAEGPCSVLCLAVLHLSPSGQGAELRPPFGEGSSLLQFAFVFVLAPGKKITPARGPKHCCGAFLLEIVDAKSVSGSVHQNPVVLLLQGVFVRISASAASRTSCARSLYVDLLSKIALSGSLRQDPVVGPLVQDHCMRISCARCLSRDVCMRSL